MIFSVWTYLHVATGRVPQRVMSQNDQTDNKKGRTPQNNATQQRAQGGGHSLESAHNLGGPVKNLLLTEVDVGLLGLFPLPLKTATCGGVEKSHHTALFRRLTLLHARGGRRGEGSNAPSQYSMAMWREPSSTKLSK